MKRGQAFGLSVRVRGGEGEKEERRHAGDREREVDCLDAINLGVCTLKQSVDCEQGETRSVEAAEKVAWKDIYSKNSEECRPFFP